MKHKTMLSLATVHQQCIADNKSQEDTLQLMQDATGQSLDTCLKYYHFEPYFHQQLFNEINTILSVLDRLNPVELLDGVEIFELLTVDADLLYVKSNLNIDHIKQILSDVDSFEIVAYTTAEEDYDGDLDYILIKQ